VRREDLADADCGIAQTLGVVGDWWSWLILREVAGGTSRFDDLQASLGISRRALTERLSSLREHGLLQKVAYSQRPLRHDYQLTARGDGLLPVLLAMQEYGDRYLLGDGSVTATAQAASPEVDRVQGLLGRRVPDLSLPAHDETVVTLRGPTWRVLYLFPGAFAPDSQGYPPGWGEIPGAAGCTLESTTYAKRHQRFTALGCEIFGVSTQRPDQQAAFAVHARLPFRLLSDQDNRLSTALRLPTFRAAGTDRFKRHSLLIDAQGVVRHVQMPITDPAGSVDEMLDAVTEARHLR
jgi:DNA-binding HxlR family transcriptional regulator/peroxiredoxin